MIDWDSLVDLGYCLKKEIIQIGLVKRWQEVFDQSTNILINDLDEIYRVFLKLEFKMKQQIVKADSRTY